MRGRGGRKCASVVGVKEGGFDFTEALALCAGCMFFSRPHVCMYLNLNLLFDRGDLGKGGTDLSFRNGGSDCSEALVEVTTVLLK